ncbi:hypothetical protein CEUSTIGMA_g1989.t1 [Chlamydomonas eustigma]|uniref:Glycosyl transferase family 28 C-terminal domain-containing protein n=1 Tax=Chlamydomonas eustigma TaxID=1157962 RepID=A0A250WVI2_9CHLO|nr:hypothetical protein CEUSTIGMA_g1989.t1 [Chlamydomonas eustigma]|eukprot:GAX74540.1 hypothetical protein CEUSTIGMA_g1989.t1 [Chlamydomonas eustigma]
MDHSERTASRIIFVTVGTTKFDALIKAIDDIEFADAAIGCGYNRLIVQRGAGSYIPHNLVKEGEDSGVTTKGLEVQFFQYAPSLRVNMLEAMLVISHAGAGSIFEALSCSRPLIVVPNPLLMDNHQAELGKHLAELKHLVCSTPERIVEAMQTLDTSKLVPYVRSGTTSEKAAAGIVSEISKAVGFAPRE